MTQLIDVDRNSSSGAARRQPSRVSTRAVVVRRAVTLALVVLPLAWATSRAVDPGQQVVNTGGLANLAALLATALHPASGADFLARVVAASLVTLEYATLATLGALLIGAVGGLVLSDVAWAGRLWLPVRALRLALRAVLVVTRSLHELVWALLLVSVLGLDPVVGVLAIALPFGAQTAKVFAETLDAMPQAPHRSLRSLGAKPFVAFVYAVLPAATPQLLSYSFYRFECSVRSTVLLGVVGVGGLGQELVVSLQSRNWDEVWTLIAAIIVLSALVDLWSSRVRADVGVGACSDWAPGRIRRYRSKTATTPNPTRAVSRSRWAIVSALVVVAGALVSWWASGVSPAGLWAPRTRRLSAEMIREAFPPVWPQGGPPAVVDATLDTLAIAVLAMGAAVLVTLLLAPWAAHPTHTRRGPTWPRTSVRYAARLVLLVLRSIPPSVWAIIALLALFPGILPGALALGLYTGGILGRLVAEAWEGINARPRDALRAAGVSAALASVAATTPPSARHLLTYTLYRFEICIRDTAVVGIVGAAGLGRLLDESLAAFRWPAVTTVLLAYLALSAAAEIGGRGIRRALTH